MPKTEHIVIIHGLADLSKQWRKAEPFFKDHGFNVHFFDYRTFNNELNIPSISDALSTFVTNNIGNSAYQIFAHSQGGLIAEWYDLFSRNRNLKRIVTIGTPYQGNLVPLFTPQKILKKLPVSRKQVEDLSYLSPVLSTLIRKRLSVQSQPTEYITLISHSTKILNIEGDGVVSVCAGNRNAGYHFMTGKNISPVFSPTIASVYYIKTNHLPVTMVRKLLAADRPNPFSKLILSALYGEVIHSFDPFKPMQCGMAISVSFTDQLHVSGSLKKIISRPTPDGKYCIHYFAVRGTDPYVIIDTQSVPLVPGKFTYFFEHPFFNTET